MSISLRHPSSVCASVERLFFSTMHTYYSLMERPESIFTNPFGDVKGSPMSVDQLGSYSKEIIEGAGKTLELREKASFPGEDEAVTRALYESLLTKSALTSTPEVPKETAAVSSDDEKERDLIISFRLAFSGFLVSLVDCGPSEIALVTLKNINALATWNLLRTTDSTIYITVADLQVDNMLPNAPYPIAVSPDESREPTDSDTSVSDGGAPPLLVVGLSFAPKHKSGIVVSRIIAVDSSLLPPASLFSLFAKCLKSVTVAPRNLAIRVDLAFLVRLQKYFLDIQAHLRHQEPEDTWATPDINGRVRELEAAASSGVGSQKFYLGGLTILPCNIKLSVAPAKALTPEQAALEGEQAAAIHQAVRKGDVRLEGKSALLGVKIGHRNATPLAVVRGVLKSMVVDGLLRLDGASLNFAGVSLRNHISTPTQLRTHLGAHYLGSLRHNVPALLGSLAAFGNPLGLVRGLGDGVR